MSWGLAGAGAGVLVVAAVAIWLTRLYGRIDAARESAMASEKARADEELRRRQAEDERQRTAVQLRETAREYAAYQKRAEAQLQAVRDDVILLEQELAELATPSSLRDRLDDLMRHSEERGR